VEIVASLVYFPDLYTVRYKDKHYERVN